MSCAYKVKHFPRHNRLFFSVFFHFPAFSCPPRPKQTCPQPLAYKSTAPCVQIHRPEHRFSSPGAYKFLALGIQNHRLGRTNSSPGAYKTIASDVQTPRPTDKNFFSGTEIYFKGLEIYFKASEIYFQAFEIVLSQAVMDFIPQPDGKCPSRSASFIPAGQEESPGRCARGFHHSLL